MVKSGAFSTRIGLAACFVEPPIMTIHSSFRVWFTGVVSLVFLLTLRCGLGQPLTVEHLTTEQGLSQNSVLAIAQDSRGFMWFGTRHGLNRYDGHHFRTYLTKPATADRTDSSSLSGNYIFSLLADAHQTLWVGTQNGLNRYDPATDSFHRILFRPGKAGGLSHGEVTCLFEDHQGTLWVGTANGLNQLLDRRTLRFRTYFTQPEAARPGSNIRAIFEDSDHTLWIGTADGLMAMRPRPGGYSVQTFRHEAGQPGSLSDSYITTIAEDRQHRNNGTRGDGPRLWIGTHNEGLNRYNPASGTFTHFSHQPADPASLIHENIRTIRPDRLGRLWIGTQEGLSLFDPVKETFTSYRHEPANPRSLSRNSIYSIHEDRAGSVWIGIYYGGINVVHPNPTDFTVHRNQADRSSLSENVVSSIVEARPGAATAGNLWIATEGGGLNFFDRKAGRFTAYRHNPADPASLGSNLVKVVYRDRRGQIWAGTHGGGLNRFDPSTNTFARFLPGPTAAHASTAEFLSVLERRDGSFWVGTNAGLHIFGSAQPPLVAPPVLARSVVMRSVATVQRQIGSVAVSALLEDARANVWIGTASGLFVYGSAATGPLLARSGLRSATINCLLADRAGRVWIGTGQTGLSVYDPRTNRIQTYTTADGLPANDVAGILEDNNGLLWISTANGLSRFDQATRTFINYTTGDGLAGNDFNYNAACKTSTGELIFGGYQGITAFYPPKISVSRQPAPVVFTDLRLFGQPVAVNGPDRLLTRAIGQTPALTFGPEQNVFSLDFALLSYNKSGRNKYAWKLDGIDRNWTHSPMPSVTYTNLPAGQHRFWVKGADNNGVWSRPAQLTLTILPPVWQTWWAYTLYALGLAGAIFFVVRFFLLRALLRRDHELHRLKLDFFTNISHEIRTHLTLISGPIERLMLVRRDDPLVQQQLGYVQKDAGRLLTLVTELMDFRKAETRHLRLQVAEYDLVAFLTDIYLFFGEVAQAKQITLTFRHEAPVLRAWFDRAQVEKILFNLLSNACKFTTDGGQIELTLAQQGDHITIQVIDNGRGIAPEYLNKLFVNYFQVNDHGMQNTGYGIGLAFSKAIAELHKGTLTVESQLGSEAIPQNRTCFTLTLRAGRQHLDPFIAPPAHDLVFSPAAQAVLPDIVLPPVTADVVEQVKTSGPAAGKLYSLLLIEDNPAVRSFISESLAGQYQVTECADGRAGWEMAITLIPDLIISDVMMPELDGFALCNQLKADERTSHIPVILLTAQNSTANQVSGLALGADCYLTKPFSLQVLELHSRNLLTARETMRARFSRQLILQPQNIEVSPVDEQFLNRLMQILEQHVANPEFDVNQLITEVGMSRSVLYRKLKALTDRSVNDFIKSFRLQKATQLLKQKHMTINEVAYAVGFNDRKYFSIEFKRQFGKTPREYADEGIEV